MVSNPTAIAISYAKGWFLLDLLAALPFDLLFAANIVKDVTGVSVKVGQIYKNCYYFEIYINSGKMFHFHCVRNFQIWNWKLKWNLCKSLKKNLNQVLTRWCRIYVSWNFLAPFGDTSLRTWWWHGHSSLMSDHRRWRFCYQLVL